jgi:hypothetical protein
LNIYIYDIEVFSDDWIVDFSRPELDAPHITIVNDNARLRAFLDQPDIILGGFNNKHYDDYVVMVMLAGGSNIEVKRANDYIIGGGKGWEIPFIQYQKKPFKSFDLKDDIADPGISLKAIEGNLKLPIVESSVPFDIDRKLTDEELEEVIKYCQIDVNSTKRLYWERKANYLDAKVLAGSIYGISEEDALGYTNAKLSAIALEAKYTERDDEREYKVPERLPLDKIPKIVLDFFLQIQDKSIPSAKLFGSGKGGSKGMTLDLILKTGGGECPVTYAWGGVHGAPPCITIESDDEYYLFMDDVGSLYPNSMINFGYTSRSMKDPDAYKKLVELRLHYKTEKKKADKLVAKELGATWHTDFTKETEEGDLYLDLKSIKKVATEETYKHVLEFEDYDAKQSSLKLIINTCYGAMLSKGNGLNDRLGGRSVCITNQLAMTVLITMLAEECKSIWFFNINTDGIGYRIHKSEVEKVDRIIKTWCEDITGFTMERTVFKKFIQKDVNNYIGITPDGKFKTKGGYVSLYKGGSFKTNSLSIIHKAIVDKLVKGIDPETTIRECTDITAFQQIIKTGGTFEGSYQYINGERIPIQKVNRVYAVKDKKYGQVVKGKWITEKRKKNKDTGKMESTPVDPPVWSETVISECPTHAGIDNENKLTVADLDLDYYIDMANKRIDKYINMDPSIQRKLNKINKEVIIMAETKKTEGKNVYQKLAEARARFLSAPVKKSGVNRFAEFKYFELEDIVPVATSIFNDLGLLFSTTVLCGIATGILFNVDDPYDCITVKLPLVDLTVTDKDGNIKPPAGMNSIQALGASITYVRRYLYMLILDIVEADALDATSGKADPETGKTEAPKKSNKPVSPEKREKVKEELINQDGEATDTQIKAIKNGLKKLRDKEGGDYESYIGASVKRLKAGITKTEAEDLLIEIGNKVAE